MLLLAIPVVLAELGWVTMGLVDTLMVGGLGPEAIGAVGIGTSVFMGVCIFAMGLLLGLDTLVSQSFGAGRLDECHSWLVHGVVLSVLLAIPITLILRLISSALGAWGLNAAVLALLRPYLSALTWSVLPLLLYASFRRYLQGMGIVRPVMFALIAANIVNLFVNWLLIFGRLGAPALGVTGSAWATVIARLAWRRVLLVVIVARERGRRPGLFATPLRVELARMRRLLSLGLPAASQITLEVGVFAAATALAGRLAPASLAAHQIAVNLAAFTFMVPLGCRVGWSRAGRPGRGPSRSCRCGARGLDGPALRRVLHGLCGLDVPACSEATHRRLHTGPGRDRHRRVAAVRRRNLSDVRRCARRRDRSPARPRGHSRRHVVEPRGALVHRTAARIRAVFQSGVGVIGLWWGLSTGLIICGIALLVVWSRHIGRLVH